MNFESYYRNLRASVHSSMYKLLNVRAENLRECLNEGIVQESSAILHLHAYAMELDDKGDDWQSLDDLMGYTIIEKGRVAQIKHKSHSPETARETRGDFDGSNYRRGRKVRDVGIVEHSLHMPKG